MTDLPDARVVAAALRLVLDSHQRYQNDELGGVRLNLRGANLRGADMTEADMTGACMIRARMADTLMIGVDMTGALMIRADLRGASLQQQVADLICPAPTAPPTHDRSQP